MREELEQKVTANETAANETAAHETTGTRPDRKTEGAATADTPGPAYVAEYLSDACNVDTSWISEAIDSGELIACPHCRFLYLPTLAFPLEDAHTTPACACDVCAYVPDAARFGSHSESVRRDLDAAPGWLQSERDKRAEALYTLWIGRTNGADALVWAAMRAAVESVMATATPRKGG